MQHWRVWLQRIAALTKFAIISDMSSIARQGVEDASTRIVDEFSRRLQESFRAALPRLGGITGRELENYLGAVVAPVVGDFVREMRSVDAKLTDQVEHLRRWIELLDIRTRNQPEPRKILFRVQQLEMAVASLRNEIKK
jgi:hypothetical protein